MLEKHPGIYGDIVKIQQGQRLPDMKSIDHGDGDTASKHVIQNVSESAKIGRIEILELNLDALNFFNPSA